MNFSILRFRLVNRWIYRKFLSEQKIECGDICNIVKIIMYYVIQDWQIYPVQNLKSSVQIEEIKFQWRAQKTFSIPFFMAKLAKYVLHHLFDEMIRGWRAISMGTMGNCSFYRNGVYERNGEGVGGASKIQDKSLCTLRVESIVQICF